MKLVTLEQLIKENVRLSPRPNSRGFFSVLCKVCNDSGRKGLRAGFKFEGNTVGYNCFNCSHSAGYDPMKHETMPSPMVTVLDAFGIAKVDWEQVLYGALIARGGYVENAPSNEPRLNLDPDEQQMHPDFYSLTDNPDDKWAQEAIYYLGTRKIDWKSHPFQLVKKSDHPTNKLWYGRLIIPIYKQSKLVFWQGRDLTDSMIKKYLSLNVPKDNIIGGYDQVHRYTDQPLYITEGWFDAYFLEGVSIFGNRLTPAQIKIINQSSRQKVVVPDKSGDGHVLARQAIDLGWAVSFPDIGSCKDINDAVNKYGELYTKMTVKQHTHDGFLAEAQIGIYCEPPTERRTPKGKKVH